jgi:murein DD-endopeptidase MepM/ murein hydrolase activator NlpD
VSVTSDARLSLRGSLAEESLNFFRDSDNSLLALQGIHALIEPGLHQISLNGEIPDGTPFGLTQMVYIQDGRYPYDRPLIVDPDTIDPAVTAPEDELWDSLSKPASPEKLWSGVFQLPSPLPADYCLETGDCWSSRFGNRRSYNGGPYDHYHTGLDIVGMVGREIFAPAPGIVVFSGEMAVRGKATMINHGWGVYTAYLHQSEIYVEVGEQVETKQLIGLIGNTGRVEGPHLHWEVIVGGIQVDPLEWLERTFP